MLISRCLLNQEGFGGQSLQDDDDDDDAGFVDGGRTPLGIGAPVGNSTLRSRMQICTTCCAQKKTLLVAKTRGKFTPVTPPNDTLRHTLALPSIRKNPIATQKRASKVALAAMAH